MLELVAQAHALAPVALVLDQDLVNLGHLDAPLYLLNLEVAPVEFSALLPYRPLVRVDELLGLRVLLAAE